ncbi:MAG TPA: alkyl sulfatase dimerization domain-containing protein [Phytomonospora sp.]
MTELNFADRTDFDDADRGFIGTRAEPRITAPDGRVVWDLDAYKFLDGDCPDTVHPSLWRQGQLCARHGLYSVTEGIYQVRGFDISNITFVVGDTGIIVIDPLISVECAAAALALYREHRGDRPVTGVIYTHSHGDHFGGVAGVTDGEGIPIIAPEGFLEHAVSENVYAGTAMTRRADFQYGMGLDPGPEGHVGLGLGIATSAGTFSLYPPTVDVTRTGQEETVDGVRIVFQLTPGTEAPAEMNFLFPDHRALCTAENTSHNLHNVLTLRGALVRDARIWSHYINEAVELFDGEYDLIFASHHWPTWGADRCRTFLAEQRDAYAYLHDQTLRLLNKGRTGAEIAEELDFPPALARAWHLRGYYGSVSHNLKAIYQRYLGWFDGIPAHLWEHPPVAAAERYVECLGGVEAAVGHAKRYADQGDLRFAAQLLQQAVFTAPDDTGAKEALADVYQRLGYGSENGTWRNYFLSGARELREGHTRPDLDLGAGMAAALTVEQLFDTVAIRLDGPRAAGEDFAVDWHFTDLGENVRTALSNGALIQTKNPKGDAELTVTLTKQVLLGLLAGRKPDGVEYAGDTALLPKLIGLLDAPDPGFAIVTP